VTESQFPAPRPGDSDDVVLALETARVLFMSGEAEEAVRRLRRAAEAAEQHGDDLRAVALARAAADLTTALERAPAPADASKSPLAPSVAPAPVQKSLPPPRGTQGSASTAPGRPSGAPRQGTNVAGRPNTNMPPPPSSRRAATPDPAGVAADPEAASKASPPSPPLAYAGAAPVSISPSSLSSSAEPAEQGARSLRSKRRPPKPKPEQAKRVVASPGDGVPKAEARTSDLADAVRVALKPSCRDDRLLIVRLLKPGEEPAPGYRPALVVMLDSGGNSSTEAK
jgi:hypothetical protein